MTKAITTMGILAGLLGIFGCGGKKDEQPVAYDVAEVYSGLRTQVLTIKPTDIGLTREGSGAVWGLLMETGYPEVVATLVALADGTVSMYFSNGGGIIGVGQHDGPRKAAAELLVAAVGHKPECVAVDAYPLPKNGMVRFYLLTWDGVLAAEAVEEDLGDGRSRLSPLFHKAHELISAVRLAEEQTRAEQQD
jgi:hypothetical protein